MSNQSINLGPIAVGEAAMGGSRKWVQWVIVGLLAVTILAVAWLVWRRYGGNSGEATVGQYHAVAPVDLDVKINKDGELQAVNNIEIACQIEGAGTVQWVIAEGTVVKKGEKLIVLDSTAIRERRVQLETDVDQAKFDEANAADMQKIQESQNSATLEAAVVGLELVKLDLLQYVEGTYPQQVQTATTALAMAKISKKNKDEDLLEVRRLFAKGFVTAADVKKAELDQLTGQNEVQKAETTLTVLEKYAHEADLTAKRSAVTQAEQKLARTKNENATQLNVKVADLRTKQTRRKLLEERLEHFREQEGFCTIIAPEDGLVLYSTSGDRSAREPLQVGSIVREKQSLLRLPDVREMKAVIRLPEGQAARLEQMKEREVKALVRFHQGGAPVIATLNRISQLADNSNRWLNPDLKEYTIDFVLDETPAGMRPGFSASVEILVAHAEDTLAVPVVALYAQGQDSYVFARRGETAVPVKVETGLMNETHVELKSGIKEGDDVLLLQPGQGRSLLEKAGVKVEPTSQPSFDNSKKRGGRRSRGPTPPPGAGGPQATVNPAAR